MSGYLVFNHHSLPFDNRTTAESAIPGFLKTCIEAQNAGMKNILVDETVDRSWFRIQLASEYFWKDWHDQHNNESNRDLIRAFRSIATQSPFFSNDDINAGSDLFEVTLDNNSSYRAVRAAAWHESPITGFETRPPWNSTPLKVNITQMNPETTEIECKSMEVTNFYNYSIFAEYLPEILKKLNASLSSGREIVSQFEELYPGVFLCGKAEQQLNNWSASSNVLDQVKQSLLGLSQYTFQWEKGKFSNYSANTLRESGLSFQVSGESQTVRTNPSLRREREFWLPTGREKFFEQHIKMSFGYRLHFFPDQANREIYVGYIGPHLKLK